MNVFITNFFQFNKIITMVKGSKAEKKCDLKYETNQDIFLYIGFDRLPKNNSVFVLSVKLSGFFINKIIS